MAIGSKRKALGTLLGVTGGLTGGLAGGVIGGIIGVVAISAILTPAAKAQETVLDAVENITEHRSGNYFRNRTIFGQVGFITGLGGFPEQRINKDSAALSEAYRELMVLQTQNTATSSRA